MSRRSGSGAARRRAISSKTISSRTSRERHQPPPGRAAVRAAAAGGSRCRRSRARARSARRPRARAGVVGVEAEQRPHRDPHRQVAHPARRRRRSPPAAAPPSAASASARHRLDRRLDLLAVEGGHHDPPGAVVVAAVDRQQAVAEQRDQVAEAALAPVEVLRVGDGDVVVGLGAEHEDDPRVQQPQAEDRPVALVAGEQQRQRVVGHLAGAREAEAGRPGRIGNPLRAARRRGPPRPEASGFQDSGSGRAALSGGP